MTDFFNIVQFYKVLKIINSKCDFLSSDLDAFDYFELYTLRSRLLLKAASIFQDWVDFRVLQRLGLSFYLKVYHSLKNISLLYVVNVAVLTKRSSPKIRLLTVLYD